VSDPPPAVDRARLFVAVWPSERLVAVLSAMRGDDAPGVRWMGPDHWHVTLRFLGTTGVAEALIAFESLRGQPAVRAEFGTRAVHLGREVLALPVEGLADLAAVVDVAFAGVGRGPSDRPFRGHVTLARGKAVRRVGRPSLDERLGWTVEAVTLVRSHLGPAGARYEIVSAVPLAQP
jgi:2'-5' RNA ligase